MAWYGTEPCVPQQQHGVFNMLDSQKASRYQVGTRLIPLTEWSKHHPSPPLGGLRHLVFHAKTNGFDKVIRRVAKRILIDEAAFFLWVEENNHCGRSS